MAVYIIFIKLQAKQTYLLIMLYYAIIINLLLMSALLCNYCELYCVALSSEMCRFVVYKVLQIGGVESCGGILLHTNKNNTCLFKRL